MGLWRKQIFVLGCIHVSPLGNGCGKKEMNFKHIIIEMPLRHPSENVKVTIIYMRL